MSDCWPPGAATNDCGRSRALPGGSPSECWRVATVNEGRGGNIGSPTHFMWRDPDTEEKAS
jgi:hypothetical protein